MKGRHGILQVLIQYRIILSYPTQRTWEVDTSIRVMWVTNNKEIETVRSSRYLSVTFLSLIVQEIDLILKDFIILSY